MRRHFSSAKTSKENYYVVYLSVFDNLVSDSFVYSSRIGRKSKGQKMDAFSLLKFN